MTTHFVELKNDTITFGKYKNKTLSVVLKDRNYCKWLIKQDWFVNNYSYLFNRVRDYKPLSYFIYDLDEEKEDKDNFLHEYEFFRLKTLSDITLDLTENEKKCYEYYTELVNDIKRKINLRIESNSANPYDIKAPTKWLQKFEKEYEIDRSLFKEFLSSYELLNLPYIIERVKKEGGIEYKGAQSFNIAKQRSLVQEKLWEDRLKLRYGEDISTQFKYDNCIFDFLNISTNTIFECKLGLNDFNEEQHKKYKVTLDKYRIIYLISDDCVVELGSETIFTTNPDRYSAYLSRIDSKNNVTYLDELIKNFIVIKSNDLSILL